MPKKRRTARSPPAQPDIVEEEEEEDEESSQDEIMSDPEGDSSSSDEGDDDSDESDSEEDPSEAEDQPATKKSKVAFWDADEGEEETAFEKKSRVLDEERAADEEEDKEERQQSADASAKEQTLDVPIFPEDQDRTTPETPSDVLRRIEATCLVLADFKQRKQQGRSRSDYTAQLTMDLSAYYAYSPWLVEKFLQLLPVQEVLELMEANEVPRPVTIRANTIKARRRDVARELIARGVNLDPLAKWSQVGLQVYESTVPIGATPEYLAGHYILQSAASFLPVVALEPVPDERVLDMCAAPGGKTTYIGALMKNTGCLFANDVNKDRVSALSGNIHRLGVRNTVITTYDGRQIPSALGQFDRILLDAPCTGTGILARDPSAKLSKSLSDLQKCQHLQKELILAAIDSLNHKSTTGNVLVYSTCSILVEENEEILEYAMKMRPVKLMPVPFEFGSAGFTRYRQYRFHPSMKHARRFYPHRHNLDGFFVARLVKTGPSGPGLASTHPTMSAEELHAQTSGAASVGDDERESGSGSGSEGSSDSESWSEYDSGSGSDYGSDSSSASEASSLSEIIDDMSDTGLPLSDASSSSSSSSSPPPLAMNPPVYPADSESESDEAEAEAAEETPPQGLLRKMVKMSHKMKRDMAHIDQTAAQGKKSSKKKSKKKSTIEVDQMDEVAKPKHGSKLHESGKKKKKKKNVEKKKKRARE